jgi:(1->4)-alpha-D-glucan 1-alpha-D-glucosylmutase
MLSVDPDAWLGTVEDLRTAAASHRRGDLPDGHAEWLVWQSLLAAWPIDGERLAAVLLKSLREAKLRTSWSRVDAEYERDVITFARDATADPAVTAALERFLTRIEPAARVTSLAMTLLRLTVPGVPDIYQGTELWAHDLVDPDNRRPVDFAARQAMLADIADADAAAVLARADEGAPKLWLIARTLAVRAADPSAFVQGAYEPLETGGDRADRLVGFGRGGRIATIVPRLVADGGPPAGATVTLPAGSWRDALTGVQHAGGEAIGSDALLSGFPVALLVREDLAQGETAGPPP